MMSLADVAQMAIRNLESAEVGFLEGDQAGAQTAALISIAASLIRLTAPSSVEVRRSTYGEYDHDATVMDREEIWHHDETQRQRDLRDARD